MNTGRFRSRILGLIVLMGCSIIFTMAVGPVYIPPGDIVEMLSPSNLVETARDLSNGDELSTQEIIIFQVRLPRILLGLLVGAALSVAGVVMQGLFKNPMAEPYIIGISSGAGLGAALCIASGIAFGYATPMMAFIGALAAIFLVYNIAHVGGKVPVDTLLLSGIAVSYFLSALTSFLMYMSDNLHQIVFWLMGGLDGGRWIHVKILFPIIFFGILSIYFFSRDMNVMLLGEESAQHLGIEVEQFKRLMMVLASLITAAAVSVSGLIGFVGLMIPHIMRLLFGPDHRILIPSSALSGGIFLVLTDTLARTALSPTQLPVGILTASFGAPFFIYLLRSRKKEIFG
ncbi:MAG: iron chelate uptake ABC transporter family permease subunit [Halobacteriota archaeon]|nr:iron chelate uptake ABC transporter family permease subunit [Halobacteriota archaeon]